VIAYSIRAAQAAGAFDRILVSTDSDEIGAVATRYGAEVPFVRPAELADDTAGTDEVILHALAWLSEHDCAPRYACCIYATAPFIRPEDIRRGLELLRGQRAATAFSVTTYPYTIFRSLKLDDRGRLEMVWPENFVKRSQDLPEALHDAGQFYWCDVDKYMREKRMLSGDAVPVLVPRHLVQDIDTPEDWEVALRMFAASGQAPDLADTGCQ
jgi:pseudaminic acid cytidylyltransferase